MTIETKFNLGQLVFKMTENKVVSYEVGSAVVYIRKTADLQKEQEVIEYTNEIIINYKLTYEKGDFHESLLFATKEELLASL